MSNRMLRPWINSEKVNGLSVHAERFFTRLIMVVDDLGCFYANTMLLRANLFPLLLDSIKEADLIKWLGECQKAGLIIIYQNEGKKYLKIIDFRQRLDRAKSKFPQPVNEPQPSVNDLPAIVNGNPPEVEVELEEEKEVERKKNASGSRSIENPFSDKFLNSWLIWKDYKKKEFGFSFKSFESEQASLNELVKKSEGREEYAIKIIQQSMANGWKGLFTLKNEKNGKQVTRPEIASSESAAEYDKLFAGRYGKGGSTAS